MGIKPYARPNERKTGDRRPKIFHTGSEPDLRSPAQRRAEKETVKAERRAIKKSARQELKRRLRELDPDT